MAFYRELGYLPAGLVNYLGRLGWSLDDKTEIIGLEEMIAKFSLDALVNMLAPVGLTFDVRPVERPLARAAKKAKPSPRIVQPRPLRVSAKR